MPAAAAAMAAHAATTVTHTAMAEAPGMAEAAMTREAVLDVMEFRSAMLEAMVETMVPAVERKTKTAEAVITVIGRPVEEGVLITKPTRVIPIRVEIAG